jgi:hypothetical protein
MYPPRKRNTLDINQGLPQPGLTQTSLTSQGSTAAVNHGVRGRAEPLTRLASLAMMLPAIIRAIDEVGAKARVAW